MKLDKNLRQELKNSGHIIMRSSWSPKYEWHVREYSENGGWKMSDFLTKTRFYDREACDRYISEFCNDRKIFIHECSGIF